VRALAHRAAEAAKRSAEIIEKTIADIGTGAQLVSRAQVEFNRVSSDILNSGEVVSQIAVRSEEQAQGVGQIRDAISRIEDITQRNADNSRRTAETAVMMSGQVQSTREHVEQLLTIVGLSDKS
jgi:methyl-accepting chemotaxis protein